MISIILPTYNSIDYLEERVDTILNQTSTDWECVVIDGESKDGTWEYLQHCAKEDNQFRLFQFPPNGVYDAWNKGIKLSEGDYIYFATSDDTMTDDCLEQLLLGFEKAPTASIAHCNLKIIDETSKIHSDLDWYKFESQQFFGSNTYAYHLRKAPLSGLLYATHQTIIHSFTQVLIKKEVFDKIGCFLEDAGPIADMEWGMRALLSEDVVHVPLELATWRVHPNQLTTLVNGKDKNLKLMRLLERAIENSKVEQPLKNRLLENKFFITAWLFREVVKSYSVIDKMTSLKFHQFYALKKIKKGFSKALIEKGKYHVYLMNELLAEGTKSEMYIEQL